MSFTEEVRFLYPIRDHKRVLALWAVRLQKGNPPAGGLTIPRDP